MIESLLILFSLALGQNVSAAVDFLSDFDASRARFRNSCISDGRAVFCREYKIESKIDRDLSIDVGYFGGTGDKLILIQSGIHGPETPAGAAVQQLFFENYMSKFLDDGVDVLLVHSLNPYGFKFGRRVNEDGIDLNRNFSLNSDLYQTENPAYARMRPVLERSGKVNSFNLDRARIEVSLIWKYALAGFDRRQANAIISGQYQFPRGLNYGGNGPAEQVRILSDLYGELFSRYKQILFLDVHTGLGENGVLHVLPSVLSNSAALKDLVETFAPLKNKGVQTVDLVASKKFYSPKGDVIDFVSELAPKSVCAIALTLEYGTLRNTLVNELDTVSRLILENQAHFHGCASSAVCAEVKRAFVDLFNPNQNAWRAAVLNRANGLFEALANGHFR